MFVVNPDHYLMPSYRISPFKTEDLPKNAKVSHSEDCLRYFDNRFGAGKWQFTINGREAIKIALANYNLDKNDLVTILTTSENFYISSCVTKEIEEVCRWNREILSQTKLLFVNHEFGYPYPNMDRLLATGIPIIEDCCTTFFSQDESGQIGSYGDFAVYSFPKFFSMQIGGLVVFNQEKFTKNDSTLNSVQKQYITDVMSDQLQHQEQIIQKREENFDYAVKLFARLGFTPRFFKRDNVVPSVLLLNNNGVVKDLNALKTHLFNNGIQNSIFYGEDAFFIPNHNKMEQGDIDYFFEVIAFYLENYNE